MKELNKTQEDVDVDKMLCESIESQMPSISALLFVVNKPWFLNSLTKKYSKCSESKYPSFTTPGFELFKPD